MTSHNIKTPPIASKPALAAKPAPAAAPLLPVAASRAIQFPAWTLTDVQQYMENHDYPLQDPKGCAAKWTSPGEPGGLAGLPQWNYNLLQLQQYIAAECKSQIVP